MSDVATLKVFLTVAEEQSFSAAARLLSMTPASVTRAIAGLEAELGVQLLLRTTRKVSLTSAGAVYAARVKPLVLAFDAASEAVREEDGITSGLIRISAPLSMGLRLLPDAVRQFRSLHPATHISLNLSDHFVDILSGAFDLAIRISTAPTDKSTIWRKICPVPRCLIASPKYLEKRTKLQMPDDLSKLACLAYAESGLTETWTLSKDQSTRTLVAGSTFSSNSGDMLRALAVDGEGVALLPEFLVEENLRNGSLIRVLPDWQPTELWLTLYYPPYEKLPLRVATFSDFFEKYVNDRPPLTS
ncbi:LysR family transcriptional regulator [Litoreibacter roseus]|uniref:LysR family transcriptional regulator n=1 Tax=Litoreibacter roseus TaxID=2601869 RepID=A0A6N6JGU9_9RHOB|nr:LysR family transcriptional regulator [Litoreibacter roseus]GFE65197.1 LysR family transcriptional regulator [Litoreibacter roseus]